MRDEKRKKEKRRPTQMVHGTSNMLCAMVAVGPRGTNWDLLIWL
jgi:hypothetical protein